MIHHHDEVNKVQLQTYFITFMILSNIKRHGDMIIIYSSFLSIFRLFYIAKLYQIIKRYTIQKRLRNIHKQWLDVISHFNRTMILFFHTLLQKILCIPHTSF